MTNNKRKIIFSLAIVFLLSTCYLLLTTSVKAAEPLKLQVQFPCSPIAGGTCTTDAETAQSPAAYIARFYQFALMISGALAFAMIIFGAIQYIVSAGNATQQNDARDRIFQALWGVALLLGAWLILYTIDPKLVSLTDPELKIVPVQYTPGIPEGFTKTTPGAYETAGGTNPTTGVQTVGGIQYQWAENCPAGWEPTGLLGAGTCERLYGASNQTCCSYTPK